MNRRILTLVAALATLLALSGCAGLPTSSPVQPGVPASGDGGAPDFVNRPDPPKAGGTPEEIVTGFIRAGSGPSDNWLVARQYLTPDNSWRPNAGVVIDTGQRTYTDDTSDNGTLTLSLTQTAQIDAAGSYAPTETGSTRLPFELVKQNGEWRISRAPDGVVMTQNVFLSVYRRYSLMFFDPSWTYLVPDVRWFPTVNAPSSITRALLAGPSPWLAGAVNPAVPDSIAPPSAVPQVSGVAQVELGASAVGIDRTTLDRIQTQLAASLASAGVTEVQLLAGGTPLNASRVSTASTGVSGSALVLTGQSFGFLSGDSVDPLPGLSDAVLALPSAPTAIQVAPSQTVAAARLTSGTVVRVSSDRPFAEVDARSGMIDPTIDRYGWVWTVPHDAPAALRATGDAGTPVTVQNAWNGASAVTAMAVSRDGTRIAALVESGGRTFVWVKGIVRTADGTPTTLGSQVLEVAAAPGIGRGLTWLDDANLGVLTTGDEQPVMIEQPVGGPGSTVAAPVDSVAIAGGGSTATVRLRDGAGALYVKRGTNWNQTGSGITVLATQQGQPR